MQVLDEDHYGLLLFFDGVLLNFYKSYYETHCAKCMQ